MKKIFSGFRENITYPDSSNFRVLIQKNTYHINAHWHPCVEIILPLTGTYQVTVEDSTYDLAKGDIMFLHSGTLHELSGPTKGERLIFQFDVEILYSLREFQSLLFSFPSTFMLKRNLKDPTYTAAEGLLLSIIMEARHKKILWEAGLYSLVLQLYTLLCRYRYSPARKETNQKIHRSVINIRKNFWLYAVILTRIFPPRLP